MNRFILKEFGRLIVLGTAISLCFGVISAVFILSDLGGNSLELVLQNRVEASGYQLSNGKVLLIGGMSIVEKKRSFYDTLQEKIYRPLIKTFLPSSMVSGGRSWAEFILEDASDFELYDLGTKTACVTERKCVVEQSLDIGKDRILIVNDKNELSIYNAITKAWESCETSPFDLINSNWALLNSGNVLIVGNSKHKGPVDCSIEFSPSLKKFDPRTIQALNNIDRVQKLERLNDGRVLLLYQTLGGNMQKPDKFDVYDPSQHKWTHLGSLDENSPESALVLANGFVFIIYRDTGYCELINPATGTIIKCASTAPISGTVIFGSENAILLKDNSILYLNRPCQIYDPKADKWFNTGSMPKFRLDANIILLNSGKVFVEGGLLGLKPVRSCELFDPATGTWKEL